MRYHTTWHPLPSPAGAALAGDVAWVVCGDGTLRSFALDGTPRERILASATAVAGTPEVLVTLDEDGRLVRRDPRTGETRQEGQRVGTRLLSDHQQVWAVDAAGRAEVDWPPASSSWTHLGPDVARLAAADGQLWWTTTSGHLRTGDGGRLALGDLDDPTDSPLAVCAGSVWVGQDGRLLRIGVRRLDRGIDVPTGTGRPAVLACAGGRVVGGTPTAVLVLDPRVDEEMNVVDADVGGPPIAALGDHTHAWVVSTDGAIVVSR